MVVPVIAVTPALASDNVPPRDTTPPPDKPLPGLIVILEFCKLTLLIPAVPERLAFVNPEIVFDTAEIVLFVSVSVVARPVRTSDTVGNVKLVPSVPAKVIELLIANVFPLAIVRVALVAGWVIFNLLIEVTVATPKFGVIKLGLLASTRAPLPVLLVVPLPPLSTLRGAAKFNPAKLGVEVVAISCGSDKLIAPLPADAST